MKYKIIALIIIVSALFVGCEDVEIEKDESSIKSIQIEYSEFSLTCDKITNIVYIDNIVKSYDEGWEKVYHVYTPYYSKNGKICKYDNGKLVEIHNETGVN